MINSTHVENVYLNVIGFEGLFQYARVQKLIRWKISDTQKHNQTDDTRLSDKGLCPSREQGTGRERKFLVLVRLSKYVLANQSEEMKNVEEEEEEEKKVDDTLFKV